MLKFVSPSQLCVLSHAVVTFHNERTIFALEFDVLKSYLEQIVLEIRASNNSHQNGLLTACATSVVNTNSKVISTVYPGVCPYNQMNRYEYQSIKA